MPGQRSVREDAGAAVHSNRRRTGRADCTASPAPHRSPARGNSGARRQRLTARAPQPQVLSGQRPSNPRRRCAALALAHGIAGHGASAGTRRRRAWWSRASAPPSCGNQRRRACCGACCGTAARAPAAATADRGALAARRGGTRGDSVSVQQAERNRPARRRHHAARRRAHQRQTNRATVYMCLLCTQRDNTTIQELAARAGRLTPRRCVPSWRGRRAPPPA